MVFSLKQKFSLILRTRIIKKLCKKSHYFKAGRNINGKITVRHRGGGSKKLLRIIDYYRSLINMIGIIRTFEYDPNRNTLISLVLYSIGVFTYIISIEKTSVGTLFTNKIFSNITIGSSTHIGGLRINTKISMLEIKLFQGAKFVRSSGSFAKILKKKANFVFIQLRSGLIQKINKWAFAVCGNVLNFNFYLFRYKNAGISRLKGKRPCVRGVAMNPIDHPYGGGEGKKSKKSICMSPWGKLIKGKKTSKKKIMRSKWKGLFLDDVLFKFLRSKDPVLSQKWLLRSPCIRASTFVPDFLDRSIVIHTGKATVQKQFKRQYIGVKFGQLAISKQTPVHKSETKLKRRMRQERMMRRKHRKK